MVGGQNSYIDEFNVGDGTQLEPDIIVAVVDVIGDGAVLIRE